MNFWHCVRVSGYAALGLQLLYGESNFYEWGAKAFVESPKLRLFKGLNNSPHPVVHLSVIDTLAK